MYFSTFLLNLMKVVATVLISEKNFIIQVLVLLDMSNIAGLKFYLISHHSMLIIKVYLWWQKLILKTSQYQDILFVSKEKAGKAPPSFVGVHSEIFSHVPIETVQTDDGNTVPYSRGIQLDCVWCKHFSYFLQCSKSTCYKG